MQTAEPAADQFTVKLNGGERPISEKGRCRPLRAPPESSLSEGRTMTTLENRPNTALLVVDVQNGVVEGAPERDGVVANVGSLVDRARRERVPVVWVQHSDEGLARGATTGGLSPS